MRIHTILSPSYVDGPGARSVVFCQGCPLGCPGCQNTHLWPKAGGREMAVQDVALVLLSTGLDVTVSGGEPTEQPEELARLLAILKAAGRPVHVILYSGYTFEELLERAQREPAILEALRLVDVLVDGRYVAALNTATLQYRGSTNQRPIDLPATWAARAAGAAEHVVTLDWDTPEVIITPDGHILGVAPLLDDLNADGAMGAEARTRHCGSTRNF